MESDKKYLLSTRPLPKYVAEEAAAANVIIDELSFITTTAVQDDELFQKIKNLSKQQHTVVFTSMNAVDAVAAHVAETPAWKIYCIGNTTRKLIEEKWGEKIITGAAENAQRLGERLIDDDEKNVIFFCGNMRRPELPEKLRSEGGKVEEIIVYNTEETPSNLARDYDGILFFSPSAVHSFYKQNKPAKTTVLFAIGKTTEEALRQHGSQKVNVTHLSDKIEMTRKAIKHLNKTGKQQ